MQKISLLNTFTQNRQKNHKNRLALRRVLKPAEQLFQNSQYKISKNVLFLFPFSVFVLSRHHRIRIEKAEGSGHIRIRMRGRIVRSRSKRPRIRAIVSVSTGEADTKPFG